MQEFAEEYVANLQPRGERYDTRLGDDFYVSTFPNGIKTWIFLYEVNGFTRRQTLGVYPEMPLDRALETLYAARRTRSVEKELIDQGLDGNNLVRQAEDSPIDLTAKGARSAAARIPKPGKGFMAGAATGAVIGAVLVGGAVWFLQPAAQSGEASLAALTQPAAGPVQARAVPAEQSPAPVQTQAETLPAQETPARAESVETPPPVAARVAVTPAAPAAGNTPSSEANGQAQAQAASEKSLPLGESQRELIELQRDMAGTLAWSQLTSGIVRGEPIDDLGVDVELSNQPRRVFFFVRVRGMSGSSVYYRWTYEGTVVKRDTVLVGEGWHSPAFSSVTLTPEREGRWQVEVMDSEGKSLGVERFQARLDRVAALTRD